MSHDSNQSHHRRYNLTLQFISQSIQPPASILDLGSRNPFSGILEENGFLVQNTDFDLDKNPENLQKYKTEIVTAFEIFEHLLNPLSVLEHLQADRLFASVPLDLWFAAAYRNPDDPWDSHFHEFEDWQFDWLLEHAGWKIIRRKKWTNPVKKIGIRPLFRLITPRWYIVEAVKNS